MMDSLRNAAKSWVAKVLLGLLAGSFVIWGVADVFRGFGASALATVGGIEISGQDYNRALNTYLQNLGRQTGQPMTVDDARKLGLDRAVLDQLIEQGAVDNAAEGMGLAVSTARIVAETQANPAFRREGKFDHGLFVNILESNGLTEAGYLYVERQNRLRAALTQTTGGDAAGPPPLASLLNRFANEKRDARYLTVPVAETEVAAASEDEIKAHYETNPSRYTAPEYRTLAIFSADPEAIAGQFAVTAEEVAAAYESYKAEYAVPERRTVLQISFPTLEEAQKAQERIAAGADFVAIASERGLKEADITFADKSRGEFLDAQIAEAAFALAEGAVSAPVKGGIATVLLKVTKVTAGHQPSLDELKDRLTARLQLDRAREDIQSVYDSVEDARAAQTKFEDIAARANLPFRLVGPVDATGKGADGKEIDFANRDDILRAAFLSDVGVENDALAIGESYVWYEVREVQPAAVKPLDQVKAEVIADIAATKIRDKAIEKAKAFATRIKAGASFDAIAQELGATVQTATGLGRNEASAAFDRVALLSVFSVPQGGVTQALEADGRAARLIQVTAINLAALDPASEAGKNLVAEAGRSLASDLLRLHIDDLKARAGVTVNETLWQQISGSSTP
jgi:peptidyl-prolyl cis-trans isomerase D